MPMSSSSPLSPLMQQALTASQANDAQTALDLLAKACREEPESAWPQFLLGAELAQLGRMPEAEVAYANAVVIVPSFAIARFELGTLQFTSGRPSIAVVTWQPLLDLENTNHLKLFVLGYLKLAQDAFDSALRYFEDGIAANTENEPLNGNIRLLINAIHEAMSKTGATNADAGAAGQTEAMDNSFLLSAYNKSQLH
jgi:tetratricopeptide (TPR) repeat protein